MKKTLKVLLVVLFTIFGFLLGSLNINGYLNAYAQEMNYTPIMEKDQATQATKAQATNLLVKYGDGTWDEEQFVNNTWEEAAIEGVRADVAFSLMMLETGYLKSPLAKEKNNFGGLGAFEGGVKAEFDTVREGIRAVIQHIKAYASTDRLETECIDPRFQYVTRGSAIYLDWLGQRENPEELGWATAHGHGYKIINVMNRMCGYPLTPFISDLTVTRSNSTYSINATGTFASGALYKFVATNTATSKEIVIQNYSKNNTATWIPSSIGNYKIKAYVKNPESRYEFDAYTTYNVTVNTVKEEIPTTINSFTADKTDIYTEKPFTATADATSQNKPLYMFWIGEQTSNGNWSWTPIQNYSEKNTVTYTINKTGTFRLSVYVKDSACNKYVEAFKQCDVTVKNSPTTIESIKVNETNVFTGKPFTATAKATSQNKPLYMFWIGEQTSNGNWSWTPIQNYSEKNTVTYTINKPGTFRLSVYVKDSACNKYIEVLKQCDVTVKNLPTTIESIKVNETNVFTGKPFTATAKATSQNKPLYMFWIGEQTSNGNWSWTPIQNYSEKNTVTYTVNKPGTFRLSVYVKDSASNKYVDMLKQCDVIIKPTATIVLDAGHGGGDPGAISSEETGKLEEADLNLDLTLILGNILQANGVNVVYTRTTRDSNPSLQNRVDIANKNGADFFISIHHNAYLIPIPENKTKNDGAKGIETLYSTSVLYKNKEAVEKSKILAGSLTNNISNKHNLKNRGPKIRNDLPVIRDTLMPAVLIEVGFMTNDEEVLRLANPKIQQSIAQTIADTLMAYLNL